MILVALSLLGWRSSAAQESASERPAALDKVWIREGITPTTTVNLWSAPREIVLEGTVESFDGRFLVINVTSADQATSQKSISSDQVQRVEPAWSGKGTREAVQHFESERFAEFVDSLRAIDLNEVPVWQQLLLTSKINQAFVASKQLVRAGDNFIDLSKASIPPLIYAHMPLCWTAPENDQTLSAALNWIEQDSEDAKLLGASWLLSTAHGSKAKDTLIELTKSNNAAIAQLSKCQLWRSTLPNETNSQVAGWLTQRDRLLDALKPGPTEFVADRVLRVGSVDLAIGLYFQLASMQADQPHRLRHTLLGLQSLLIKQKREPEAAQVAAWIKELDGKN